MRIFERIYPIVFSITCAIIIYNQHITFNTIPKIELVLNSTVTISSILIGFLAAMVSILIAITNSKVMDRIREGKAEHLLTSYIREAIISGIFLAVGSTIAFLFVDYKGKNADLIFSVWFFMFIHFLLSSFRILIIMLNILSSIPKEYKENEKENSKMVYTPKKENAFKKDNTSS
jgi:ABC-type spermidine/putrescine transport system permease subunit II